MTGLSAKTTALSLSVVLVAAAGGIASVANIRLSIFLGLLVLVIALASRSRPAGVVALVLLWLIVPFLRRLIALAEPPPDYDILSVLPFVATVFVAMIELARSGLSRTGKNVVVLASLGFLVGVPAGLEHPEAAAYAVLAYGSALAALALGYADERATPGRSPLLRTLMVTSPVLAAYGVYQYFFPLPEWDARWVEAVRATTLASIRAPEEGHIRVFSTLNAPGVFATVLAFAAIAWIAATRLTPARLALLASLFLALALTYVRSAWLALAIGILAYALFVRRTALRRVLPIAAVAVVGLGFLASRDTTASAFVDRVATLTEPGEDPSARARIGLARTTLPESLTTPLGKGIGQAGLATKLGGSQALAAPDNGYVALLYQLGPLGFALVAAAMLTTLSRGFTAAREGTLAHPHAALLCSLLVMFIALQAISDVLSGITGVLFWYVAGQVLALAEERKGGSSKATIDVASEDSRVGQRDLVGATTP